MLSRPFLLDLLGKQTARQVVTVVGEITEIDPDLQDDSGAKHQIFTMRVDEIHSAPDRLQLQMGDLIYVAVRHGDSSGLEKPIPDLMSGQAVTVRGAFVSAEEAYEREGADRLGVIHFTHRPLGWIEYQGRVYR